MHTQIYSTIIRHMVHGSTSKQHEIIVAVRRRCVLSLVSEGRRSEVVRERQSKVCTVTHPQAPICIPEVRLP